jgi:phage terminase large subunit-like protein
MAGRGWGKTRTGAEDIAYHALWNNCARVGVVAPTMNDVTRVCMEGESGLVTIIPSACIRVWNRSKNELVLHNGSVIHGFSAEDPERLRGPQFTRAWGDEVAAWQDSQAFDQLRMCLRLGDHPQLVLTTTPKPSPQIKTLLQRPDAVFSGGASEDNANNLAPGILDALRENYAGTRWERQELDGAIVDDMDTALWQRAIFVAHRVKSMPNILFTRTVIALDPALTAHAGSDETGIIVAARGVDNHIYVLADYSGRYAPDDWAKRVISAYHDVRADYVIAETNAGGDVIARMLHMHDPQIHIKPVYASKSKAARAIPVATLYERGRVHHVATHSALEDQLCRFTINGVQGGSPDRADALVYAILDLMDPSPNGKIRAL